MFLSRTTSGWGGDLLWTRVVLSHCGDTVCFARPEKHIPIACCPSGPFDHDTTLPTPLFPGLEPMRRLGAVSPKSDEALQFAGGLARQRNTVCYHLDNALATVQAMLAV